MSLFLIFFGVCIVVHSRLLPGKFSLKRGIPIESMQATLFLIQVQTILMLYPTYISNHTLSDLPPNAGFHCRWNSIEHSLEGRTFCNWP